MDDALLFNRGSGARVRRARYLGSITMGLGWANDCLLESGYYSEFQENALGNIVELNLSRCTGYGELQSITFGIIGTNRESKGVARCNALVADDSYDWRVV